MVYKFFDKKSASLSNKSVSGSGIDNNNNNNNNNNNEIKQNLQLAKELRKPIIRKFKKRKIYSGFRDNIWGADLADMQLINKSNKGFRFSLCVIDTFSKYARVIPLKDNKEVSIVNAFQKILDISQQKPNKILVDKGSEFYNNSFKKWLKDNDIEMYSIHNEEKSVIAERFISTLKNKIYKYMTSVSKNVYIDKLDDIVDEYNNTYHRTIEMKPIDLKDNRYISFEKEVNDKDPKFKVGDHARISKYKNTVQWTNVINDLNGEKITGTFYEKELQNTNQEEFRIEKVIKRKGDALYVKWKGYDNSFNSWIDKKHLV